MAARRFFASAVVALLVVAAAPALAAPAVNPRIKPKTGHPSTTFRVAFTVPKAAGGQGGAVRFYSVDLSVVGRGCSQNVAQTVTKAPAGKRVRLRFKPPSGHWCLGKGRGTISMEESPRCNDTTEPCPDFPSGTHEVGHFKFRVVPRA